MSAIASSASSFIGKIGLSGQGKIRQKMRNTKFRSNFLNGIIEIDLSASVPHSCIMMRRRSVLPIANFAAARTLFNQVYINRYHITVIPFLPVEYADAAVIRVWLKSMQIDV